MAWERAVKTYLVKAGKIGDHVGRQEVKLPLLLDRFRFDKNVSTQTYFDRDFVIRVAWVLFLWP